MAFDDFPIEFSLRFRAHALYVHIQSTLEFARDIATEGPDNLDEADLKVFDQLPEQLERAWVESLKVKKSARKMI